MGWRKEDQRGGHPIAAEEQGARGMGQCTLPMRQPCTRTFGGQGLGKMKGSGGRGRTGSRTHSARLCSAAPGCTPPRVVWTPGPSVRPRG